MKTHLAQTLRERRDLQRYLQSMKCKACGGKGCRECGGSGDSPRFKKLIAEASTGIKR